MAQAKHTGEHIDAGHTTRFYWLIGAFLAVITAAEVAVTLPFMGLTGLPFVLLAILLVLMIVKGACVVMFFMHLRGDARVFQFLFIAPLLIATTMILLFMVINNGHVGLGG
jgi:cytochrome c oxidase subunit 4/cytochrome o ubiquinol oxidase operon protein cyoD